MIRCLCEDDWVSLVESRVDNRVELATLEYIIDRICEHDFVDRVKFPIRFGDDTVEYFLGRAVILFGGAAPRVNRRQLAIIKVSSK
jgi:hypothetical protein